MFQTVLFFKWLKFVNGVLIPIFGDDIITQSAPFTYQDTQNMCVEHILI